MHQTKFYLLIVFFIPFISYSQQNLVDCDVVSYDLFLSPKKEMKVNANNEKAELLGELFKADFYKSPLKKGLFSEKNDSLYFYTEDVPSQGIITTKVNIKDFEYSAFKGESGYFINSSVKKPPKKIEFVKSENPEIVNDIKCEKYLSADGEVIIYLSINDCKNNTKNFPLSMSPIGLPKGRVIVSYERGGTKWVLN